MIEEILIPIFFFLFLIVKDDLFKMKIDGKLIYFIYGFSLCFFLFSNPKIENILLLIIGGITFSFLLSKLKFADGDILVVNSLFPILSLNLLRLSIFIFVIFYAKLIFEILARTEIKEEKGKIKIKIGENNEKIPFTIMILVAFLSGVMYA